jgi:NAD(P)-dependent dehydrogenase (short-subunit alcohol dehydrogenase family)
MPRRVADLHRTAFVTGASAGLGQAIAAMLLADGVRVWGTSRDAARLAGGGHGSLRSLGSSPSLLHAFASEPVPPARQSLGVVAVEMDLRDGRGAIRAFEDAAREADGFDLVINNAGYGVFGEFAEVEPDVWAGQVEAMLGTSLRLSHAAYGAMRARGRGCLVNVSSLAVEFPLPFMSGYNAAKAGLAALSDSLIFESRGSPVTVIDFRPGDYKTTFNQAMVTTASVPPSAPRPERLGRAWTVLEANLEAAPAPRAAAADLRRAILRNRSAVVRSGSLFQARVAPLLARWAPAAAVRWATARYFGSA